MLVRFSLIYLFPLAAALVSCASQQLALRSSDRIIFFGDSITELAVKPGGYITLLRDTLQQKLPGIELTGAGISGNKVPDLQKRLDRDVISRRPTIVFIYIGINDVWHWVLKNLSGTTKEAYADGLRSIITTIQASGGRVILCTPTVIGEKQNGANPQDAMLDEYAGLSRRVAEETGAALCDLRTSFVEYLRHHNPADREKGILTYDGVHLSDEGNRLVARTMLTALGK